MPLSSTSNTSQHFSGPDVSQQLGYQVIELQLKSILATVQIFINQQTYFDELKKVFWHKIEVGREWSSEGRITEASGVRTFRMWHMTNGITDRESPRDFGWWAGQYPIPMHASSVASETRCLTLGSLKQHRFTVWQSCGLEVQCGSEWADMKVLTVTFSLLFPASRGCRLP